MSDKSDGIKALKEETVKRNLNRLLRTAVAIMGSKAEAEDVVQDTFMKLIEKQPDFESPEHETAWLIRVTVNLCKSRLRSHWWQKIVPLLESHPVQYDEQTDIMQTILSLPAKYRTVIHLFYYEGYSTKEIASLIELREPAVRKQLTRARAMLKDILIEEEIFCERI